MEIVAYFQNEAIETSFIEHSNIYFASIKNCGYIEYISTNYSSEIGFDWQHGGTFIQTWSLVEKSNTCKDHKWQNLYANIVPA